MLELNQLFWLHNRHRFPFVRYSRVDALIYKVVRLIDSRCTGAGLLLIACSVGESIFGWSSKLMAASHRLSPFTVPRIPQESTAIIINSETTSFRDTLCRMRKLYHVYSTVRASAVTPHHTTPHHRIVCARVRDRRLANHGLFKTSASTH